MKKNKILIILLAALIIIGLALIFAPAIDDTKKLDGSIMIECPAQLYKVGDEWKAECKLLPGASCTYFDSDGCEVVAVNASNKVLYPAMRAEVVEVKVSENVQILKVGEKNADRSDILQ